MFKAIDKPIQSYKNDRYYFELDLSNTNMKGNLNILKRKPPTQIFPIDSFEYNFELPNSDFSNVPPLPLNLLANTNYLRNFISQEKINEIKDKIKTPDVISNVRDAYAFPFGHSPDQNLKLYDPSGIYDSSMKDSFYEPIVVSHSYFFKYMLLNMCNLQLNQSGVQNEFFNQLIIFFRIMVML